MTKGPVEPLPPTWAKRLPENQSLRKSKTSLMAMPLVLL